MAKVFIGIALLFMLATAGVGFMLKGNVDKLQTNLSKTKGQIADAEGKARAAKNDAEKAQKEAKDASDKAAASDKLAADKTKEADDAKMQLAEAKTVMESKDKEIADWKAKAGTGTDPNAPTKATVDMLNAQIAQLTTDKANADKELAEAKLAADAAVAKGAENDRQLAELRKKEHERDLGIMRPGLRGRVLAVNSGWNFVVLSVGDKNGVLVNSSLVVVRGNEPVARLRVTSVEPSTAIADVLPGSVRKGVTVQPGDTVIFEGTRGNQPTSKPSGSESAPPASVPAPSPVAPGLPNS